MWAYSLVVGPAVTFVGAGVVLVAQAANRGQAFAGWVLVVFGALTLVLSWIRYAVHKDDNDHAFYRVLSTGEAKALFTYPEYRRFPDRIRVELLSDPFVDRWIQDEMDRRALRYLTSPRLTELRDGLRAFFE
jgi:hypothetical protein